MSAADDESAESCDHPVCWACQDAAELAGFERGQHHANRVAAEAIAQGLLQDRANEMLGLARREAAKVGPAWVALLEEQAASAWVSA